MSGNAVITWSRNLIEELRLLLTGAAPGTALPGLILAALVFLPNLAAAQPQPQVTASVNPARVTVGDTFHYEVTVEYTGSGQPSVAVPVMGKDSGLSTPSGARTQSSLHQYIANGRHTTIQRITYMYQIRTTKPGTFTIPPATVTMNGRNYETEPIEVTVEPLEEVRGIPKELEGLVAPPLVTGDPQLQRRLTGGIFVLPVLSKTDPYNGEQVRVSYHLVIDPESLRAARLQPRTNLDGIHVPTMNQFIKEELFPFPQDLKFEERKIGGNLYLVAPVYEAVIASTKSGELQIEPFHISMYFTQSGSQRQQQLPPGFANDPFFSSLAPLTAFGGNTVRIVAQSPTLTLDVKPLPSQGQPTNFGGAVGDFEITAEVDKRQAKANDDTIGLRVKVEGEGNTEMLSAPELPQMPGFTVLGRPSARTSGQRSGDSYISTKIFEYVLRPTQPGNTEIPAIELPYFDPAEESYKTAHSDSIAMEIAPGTRPAPTPVPELEEDEPVDEEEPEVDLRYIATGTLPTPGGGLSRIWGALGVAMFLMPPLLVGASAIVAMMRSRKENQTIDLDKTYRTQSNEHLSDASTALKSGDYLTMASKLAEGIRLNFAARLGLSPAEVTIPAIEENLAQNGAPDNLIRETSRVLETCDGAHYGAGIALNQQSANELYTRARDLLKQSEEYV